MRDHPQLILNYFQRSEDAFERRRRGPEQQSESHYEKILRFPHLPLPGTRPLSLNWQVAEPECIHEFF
jgi:hypothetical protein